LINKGFLNTNTAITRQLLRTTRMLEAEWRQILWVSVSMGAKEDDSSTGRNWAVGFYNVTARSCFAGVLKLTNSLFL
jgi:hypothetical protein